MSTCGLAAAFLHACTRQWRATSGVAGERGWVAEPVRGVKDEGFGWGGGVVVVWGGWGARSGRHAAAQRGVRRRTVGLLAVVGRVQLIRLRQFREGWEVEAIGEAGMHRQRLHEATDGEHTHVRCSADGCRLHAAQRIARRTRHSHCNA